MKFVDGSVVVVVVVKDLVALIHIAVSEKGSPWVLRVTRKYPAV